MFHSVCKTWNELSEMIFYKAESASEWASRKTHWKVFLEFSPRPFMLQQLRVSVFWKAMSCYGILLQSQE